jgi:hypothetical protein
MPVVALFQISFVGYHTSVSAHGSDKVCGVPYFSEWPCFRSVLWGTTRQ